ncbi:MAG: VOC family protein [Crocinitomicaceae bacterium]
MNPFHYAFKVKDLESTRRFYCKILGCKEGRSANTWVDFDFFGHQLSAHVSDNIVELDYCGIVDGLKVPIPHFGCLLLPSQFETVKQSLLSNEIEFLIQPQVRYEGEKGEQSTMFLLDFSGNPIEFKSFTKQAEIFE